MNKNIRIGTKLIGEKEPVYIIGEVGSNHNQKIKQAKQLIDVAAESGVDAVKFQLFRTENLYSPDNKLFKIFKENELPFEWLPDLIRYSRSKGLTFLASPFDRDSVDELNKLGVAAFKLASSETVNLPLLRYIASKSKPVLISTGMCDLADVYEAVEVVRAAKNNDMILLHCTALYPTPPENVNLNVMQTLRSAFNLPVGFSDHTLGIDIPFAAVALGARVIEKHITISRKLKGPDHSYALEPAELKSLVQGIRAIEKAFGSSDKVMLAEEAKYARRESLYAVKEISRGEKITKDKLIAQRPSLGIKPRFLNAVLEKRAKNAIKKGQCLTWEMIDNG